MTLDYSGRTTADFISMTSVALQFGAKAFAGMMDKTGREPAFFHSMRVAAQVKRHGGGEVTTVAAYLHDVIEDTPITVEDIRDEFAIYPAEKVDEMIAIILSVTRGYIERYSGTARTMVFSPPPPGQVCNCKPTSKFFRCLKPNEHLYDKETYRDFIMRSKRNPKGCLLKIEDITDNMSPARREGLSEEEKGIVEERYIPALAFLKDNKATEYFTPRQLARLCRWCSQPFGEHTGPDRKCPAGSLLFHDSQRNTFKGVR